MTTGKNMKVCYSEDDVRVGGKKAILTGLHCVLGKLPDSGFICCC